MRSQRVFTFAVLVFTLIAMRGGVLLAHHSNAEYGNKLTTMNGTVVEYRWRNPHVTVVWESKDPSGKVVRWRGELASIASAMGHCLTKTSLKAGDDIRITVFPSKLETTETAIVN